MFVARPESMKLGAWMGCIVGVLSTACGGEAVTGSGNSELGAAGTDVGDSGAPTPTGGVGGTGGSSQHPVPSCIPGESMACVCTTGRNGARVCATNGTYGPCVCEGTGGAAGTGAGPSTECPCTRRPGPGNSFRCPIGVGQSASMTIGKGGGSVTLAGQQTSQTGVPFSIQIPASALDVDTVITVTETANPPPSGFIDYSPVYTLEPASLMTAIPLPIVIGWANIDGTVDGSLAVYAAPTVSGPFERVADSYVNAGFMQASIKKFGAFFAGYPKRPDQAACP